MKIAMVTSGYAPDIGGVERHVERLSERLAAGGHEVHVFTQAQGRLASAQERRQNVDVWRFRTYGPGSALRFAPELPRRLRAASGAFDLVHAHNYHGLPALSSLLVRAPLVFTPHYHGRGHSAVLNALHAPYGVFGRRIFASARRVIAVSDAEAEMLRRDHPQVGVKLAVIPNGTDQPKAVAPQHADGQVLLSVGRLEPHKRVDALVAALSHLPAEWTLVVIGEGSARESLAQTATQDGVGRRVRFLGRVDEGELAGWYRRANVVATMSEAEAYGMVLAEALSVPTRAVASDLPSHREIVRASGASHVRLVPSDLPASALAGVIIESAALPLDAGARLPTWKEVVGEVEDVYRDALGS